MAEKSCSHIIWGQLVDELEWVQPYPSVSYLPGFVACLSFNGILVFKFEALLNRVVFVCFMTYTAYLEKTPLLIHSGQKCLPRVACLWSKMLMFQMAGMKEGGGPLPLAFQYLILMIWRPCDLDLVMISSLASKCQHFKLRGLQFHFIKWLKNGHPKFKVLAFWSQWRYHDQI